jgi:UDP-N-acetylglucosamine transferase subunit ALG13
MILVTVGTQLPFSRLIQKLDALAPSLDMKVIAQVGDEPEPPKHIEYHRSMDPRAFETLFLQADRIVAHAGIGTLLAAKKHRKPIIVFPRRASWGEHRNDHQLATAKQLEGQRGIYVAYDEAELEALLREPRLEAPDSTVGASLLNLKDAIRSFIVEPVSS